METYDGEMSLKGGRAGGQVRLRHHATDGGAGGWVRGRHPHDARPLGGAPEGGELGVLLIDERNAFNEENR